MFILYRLLDLLQRKAFLFVLVFLAKFRFQTSFNLWILHYLMIEFQKSAHLLFFFIVQRFGKLNMEYPEYISLSGNSGKT